MTEQGGEGIGKALQGRGQEGEGLGQGREGQGWLILSGLRICVPCLDDQTLDSDPGRPDLSPGYYIIPSLTRSQTYFISLLSLSGARVLSSHLAVSGITGHGHQPLVCPGPAWAAAAAGESCVRGFPVRNVYSVHQLMRHRLYTRVHMSFVMENCPYYSWNNTDVSVLF